MVYTVDNKDYEVIINRKNNKNIYIRVKEDLKIYVNAGYFVTKKHIINLLDENERFIRKAIDTQNKKNEKKKQFFYLGKSYDIIEVATLKKIDVDDINNIIYYKDIKMLNKWLKKQIINIFSERYKICFSKFNEYLDMPMLKIRSMKSRWGVYNKKNHSITLNSHLIEYDISSLDYVIYHELCHTVHFDHSKAFWKLVAKYCPNYKQAKKDLKE